MRKPILMSAVLCLVSLPLFGGVDLTLANGAANPSAAQPLESTFSINFDVKNNGNVGYSGPLAVKVPVPQGAVYANSSYSSDGTMACGGQSGQVICSRISGAAPIAPSGGTISMRVVMRAKATGTYNIPVQVDPDSTAAEDNETNNTINVNGSMSDLVRVAVRKNTCPAYSSVGQIGGHAFTLANVSTLDVRYPGLVFTVEGSQGQGIQLTSVVGGSILSTSGTPYDMSTIAPSHKFVFVPPPAKTPLLAGDSAMMTVFFKSLGMQKITVKAYIDTQAIQDTATPKDNQASCSYALQ